MSPMQPDKLRSLAWKQDPARQRRFDLHAGEDILASLEFTVREEGREEDCAIYYPNFALSQGQIRLASGEQFELRLGGIWTRSASLVDNQRREVFRIQFKGDSALGATVGVRLPETPDLDLLLLLAWYVLVLQMQDESLRAASR
jgi:hypothetical protein